ncbi:MAG: prepilin-type N-terminal cleavage/methylation domain-containing protein [Planctomycetota bacterium]|nr:prepilin-type N-terminal cleavage/methylation domain-containing protein [Planctomycetota bacterium]
MRNSRTRATRRAGFSLIEIMIGVLVLGLGLLGLAAIFPVVLRQQRIATDSVRGLSVARSAEAFLRGRSDLGRELYREQDGVIGGASDDAEERTGWQHLISNKDWSPTTESEPNQPTRWTVLNDLIDDDALRQPGALGIAIDRNPNSADRGTILIKIPNTSITRRITLADRLWPTPYSAIDASEESEFFGNEPQFVWDIALRRVDRGKTPFDRGGGGVQADRERRLLMSDDAIQVAVFVRAIDRSIVVPVAEVNAAGASESDLDWQASERLRRSLRLADLFLRPPTQVPQPLVPVAVDAAGVPTNNGAGTYSTPVVSPVLAVFDPDGENEVPGREPTTNLNRTRLRLADTPLRRLAYQANQKLIDNLGTVYTVLGVDETDPTVIQVTPGASREAFLAAETGDLEVVFTPQVPGEAIVFEIVP